MLERRLEPSPCGRDERPLAARGVRHLIGVVSLVVALVIGLHREAAGATRLRVHAAATIDAHASRQGGLVLFRGTLADESGSPLSGRPVSAVVMQGAQHAPAPIEPCPGSMPADTAIDRVRPGTGTLRTDPSGRFCVATTASSELSTVHFEWAGTPLVDPASADVTADPTRRQVDLGIACEPVIDLASDVFVLSVTARFVGEDPAAEASGLPLALTNEAGAKIARATTDDAGKAVFSVPARTLGPPGRGELRVDFAGDPATSSVRRVVEVERRVEVGLRLARELGPTLPPADPEDGVSLPVLVTTRTGEPVSTGILEASVEGHAVGAVRVDRGHADLVATFQSGAPGAAAGATAEIEIRYASDAPWFAPGRVLTVHLPIASSNPWRGAPLLAASLAVVLWLAAGRARRPTPMEPVALQGKPAAAGPRVDVVHAASDSRAGWTGRVVDSHEGTALAGADVHVERPSFSGTQVLARAVTNAAGRFELRCDEARRGDRFIVAGALHTKLAQSLPPFGQVEVGLISRRRALLDRLVAWARKRGAPFDGSPEPTPGHVARTARGLARSGGAATDGTDVWAEAVERASFGPDAVDARAEDEVERLAPRLPPPGARVKR